MSAETIRELLQRRPFETIEVQMSNGENFQIRHPEMAFVTRTTLVCGYDDSDRITICSLLHIANVTRVVKSKRS
jgi:hypothetical protein